MEPAALPPAGKHLPPPVAAPTVPDVRPALKSDWHGHCCGVVGSTFGDQLQVAQDSLFGIHAAALEVRSQRMGLLASNIANASTPGFKAKDLDFQSTLSAVEQSADAGGASDGAIRSATRYRLPTGPSLDGNTVELNAEQTAFAENAVQYQTTLSFLNGRIGQITRALKGE